MKEVILESFAKIQSIFGISNNCTLFSACTDKNGPSDQPLQHHPVLHAVALAAALKTTNHKKDIHPADARELKKAAFSLVCRRKMATFAQT